VITSAHSPGSSRHPGLVTPQFGIFAQGANAHHFLEFDLLPGVSKAEVIGSVGGLFAPHVSSGRTNLVVAFGSAAWRSIAPSPEPRRFSDFDGVRGLDRGAPATQHDVWLWVSASAPDVSWDHARSATAALHDVAVLADEQPAFVYRDNRDMTGFQDGTANPPLHKAPGVALVPSGEPGEGGSHVLVMRWIHDLAAFNGLSVEKQEETFGRTKRESIEIPEGTRSERAHISRVTVKVDGEELKIYRRSVPYGNVREQGLYFVAFSADPARYHLMLGRMFGSSGDGVHDRLTDFSKPVSGGLYFAPSLNDLNELFGLPPSPNPRT
jgi:porphyrinogen peroxidase